METPASAEEAERTDTPPTEGVRETRAMDDMTKETVVVVEDDPLA